MDFKQRNTLDQLPATAAEYYKASATSDGFWNYHYIGSDEIGRPVFEKFYLDANDRIVGRRRALLLYKEFTKEVKAWAARGVRSIGIQRWTDPYGEVRRRPIGNWLNLTGRLEDYHAKRQVKTNEEIKHESHQ